MLRLNERVALDASAAERADKAPEVVDKEFRADHLRRAPGRAYHGRDREPPPLTLELRHPSEDLPHRFQYPPSAEFLGKLLRIGAGPRAPVLAGPFGDPLGSA